MLDAILFDLDGTLLPMDMDVFTKGYFSMLAGVAAPYGYEKRELVKNIWQGTAAMVRNDGSTTNRACFWDAFAVAYGEQARAHEAVFDAFYTGEFQAAVKYTSPSPEAAQRAVALARSHAGKVILATNPIFPLSGVATRLSWLGLKIGDFDYVSTYENSCFCKPNPDYYREILAKQSLRPENCLMIGNDVDEDVLAAGNADIRSYLVLDCMINKNSVQVSVPQGSFMDMLSYLAEPRISL